MVNITKVVNLGDDVIEVYGFYDEAPLQSVVASGWLSATANFYPADQYGEDGHLIEGAQAREMTDAEKLGYYRSLFKGEPRGDVLFSNAKAIAVQNAAAEAEAARVKAEEEVAAKEAAAEQPTVVI